MTQQLGPLPLRGLLVRSHGANSVHASNFASFGAAQEPLGQVWLGTGRWDSKDFLGYTKICFMEGRKGHLFPRLTDWE